MWLGKLNLIFKQNVHDVVDWWINQSIHPIHTGPWLRWHWFMRWRWQSCKHHKCCIEVSEPQSHAASVSIFSCSSASSRWCKVTAFLAPSTHKTYVCRDPENSTSLWRMASLGRSTRNYPDFWSGRLVLVRWTVLFPWRHVLPDWWSHQASTWHLSVPLL